MINFIAFLALIFSVTNFVYISLLPLILLPIALIQLFEQRFIVSKLMASLLILSLYIIVSTLFYNPQSFFEFDFYRRDGNYFVTYLIFFVIYILGCNKNPIYKIQKAFLIISFISIFAFFIGKKEGLTIHYFFFEAHNAAGGFYGVMSALSLGLLIKNKTKINIFCFSVFLFSLLMTDSRGTVLALFFSFIYFLFSFRKPLIGFIFLCFIQALILFYSYPIWLRIGKNSIFEGDESAPISLGLERSSTIIDRAIFIWPRAFDNFISSPVTGLGFGSFDDRNYTYLQVVPFFNIKVGQHIVHTDFHSHNSFLNILSELGIIGFLLFFFLFFYIYKEIEKIEFWASDLALGLKLAFWVCIFSSATEHRLTTPSQMIPFFIVLGLSLGYTQYLKSKGKV